MDWLVLYSVQQWNMYMNSLYEAVQGAILMVRGELRKDVFSQSLSYLLNALTKKKKKNSESAAAAITDL
jgi:hypothetical protein